MLLHHIPTPWARVPPMVGTEQPDPSATGRRVYGEPRTSWHVAPPVSRCPHRTSILQPSAHTSSSQRSSWITTLTRATQKTTQKK